MKYCEKQKSIPELLKLFRAKRVSRHARLAYQKKCVNNFIAKKYEKNHNRSWWHAPKSKPFMQLLFEKNERKNLSLLLLCFHVLALATQRLISAGATSLSFIIFAIIRFVIHAKTTIFTRLNTSFMPWPRSFHNSSFSSGKTLTEFN